MAVARPGPAAPSDSHQIGRPGVKFRLAGTAAPAGGPRPCVVCQWPVTRRASFAGAGRLRLGPECPPARESPAAAAGGRQA